MSGHMLTERDKSARKRTKTHKTTRQWTFPCSYWRRLFSELHVTGPMTADERFDERWIIICQKIGSFKNWLSDAIWNEVIQQFDESVQAEILSHAVKSSFHGQADDGLTRVCIMEPFSHKTKKNHYFLVFYNLTAVNTNLNISSDTLRSD